MVHKERYEVTSAARLEAADPVCTPLSVIIWMPDPAEYATPHAVVQLSHGMEEHLERYDGFAEELCRAGFVVVGCDFVGHGESARACDAPLGYFGYYDQKELLPVDIHTLRQWASAQWPELPYFMFGHSMGSFAVRAYIAEHGEGLMGAILSGTGYQPPLLLAFGRALVKILSVLRGDRHYSHFIEKLLLGGYNKPFAPSRTAFDWLSSLDATVDAYVNDPLCGEGFTLNGDRELLNCIRRACSKATARATPHDLPLLFVSGEKDPVGDMRRGVLRSVEILQEAGESAITVKFYDNNRHEVLNDISRDEFIADVIAWMNAQLGADTAESGADITSAFIDTENRTVAREEA